jgi:hypothetical protein
VREIFAGYRRQIDDKLAVRLTSKDGSISGEFVSKPTRRAT